MKNENSYTIKKIDDRKTKIHIASLVLADIPEWFGMPKYTKEYIDKSSTMPFFAGLIGNQAIGFISLKETGKFTAEIYCMGILQKYHRMGLGRKLYKAFEKYAREKAYKFIQVKTLVLGQYEVYDRSNMFYRSLGFHEFEVLDDLWDEGNPCQIFIKSIEL